MAAFVFNIAKGRAVELFRRVDIDDPANSALVVLVLASSGLESDATLKDLDTVTALVAGTTNEVTNSGYARKVLTQADITYGTPDDTSDFFAVDIGDQTWTGVAAGDTWAKLVIAYDPDSTTGTDADLIPLTCHDFTATPNGGNITAQIHSAGFFKAS